MSLQRANPQLPPFMPQSPPRGYYQPGPGYDNRQAQNPGPIPDPLQQPLVQLPTGMTPQQLWEQLFPGMGPPPPGGLQELATGSHQAPMRQWPPQRGARSSRSRSPGRAADVPHGGEQLTPQARGRSMDRGGGPQQSHVAAPLPPRPEEDDPDGEIDAEPSVNAYLSSFTPTFTWNLCDHLRAAKCDKWSIKDKSSPGGQLAKKARLLIRQTNPFLDFSEVMTIGMMWYTGTPTRWQVPEASLSAKQRNCLAHQRECLNAFEWLKDNVPFFSNMLPHLVGHHSETILIGSFIDTHARQARATDINTLKKLAADIVEPVTLEGGRVIAPPTNIKERKDKHFFGAHAHWTLLQLLPTSALEEYIEDPDTFRDLVLNGDVEIDHLDNPYFLYPSGEFDPSNLENGLTQGEAGLKAARSILCSPSSISLPPGARSMGRGCISHIYNLRNVEPRTIAYVLTLWRNVLSSCPSWEENDGEFRGPAFFKRLVALFDGKTVEDDHWANETLAWWNSSVYGDDSTGQTRRKKKARRAGGSTRTQEQILADQRKARTAARTETPSPRSASPSGGNPDGGNANTQDPVGETQEAT